MIILKQRKNCEGLGGGQREELRGKWREKENNRLGK